MIDKLQFSFSEGIFVHILKYFFLIYRCNFYFSFVVLIMVGCACLIFSSSSWISWCVSQGQILKSIFLAANKLWQKYQHHYIFCEFIWFSIHTHTVTHIYVCVFLSVPSLLCRSKYVRVCVYIMHISLSFSLSTHIYVPVCICKCKYL